MKNLTCNQYVLDRNHLYVLNDPCNDVTSREMAHPSTSISYAVLGSILIVQAFLTWFWFNKVKIFRFHYHVPVLSNTMWTFYFIFAGFRSILMSIIYARRSFEKEDKEGWQLANWILGSIELLFFCFSLNYQRKIRCHDEEVRVDAEDLTRSCPKIMKNWGWHDIIASVLFFIIILSVVLFRVLEKSLMVWFWCYLAFTIVLILITFELAIDIFLKKGLYQPRVKTKAFFVFSVLTAAPERIPIFVWDYCISGEAYSCWHHHFDMFDLFLVFKMLSALFLFIAIVFEFRRLEEEVKFAFLQENQNYDYEE